MSALAMIRRCVHILTYLDIYPVDSWVVKIVEKEPGILMTACEGRNVKLTTQQIIATVQLRKASHNEFKNRNILIIFSDC